MLNHADELGAIARQLAAGGVALIPTETFYGLAADPRSAHAVARLIALKGRATGHPLPLIASDLAQVDAAAPGWREFPAAVDLAARHWPGPLTLVLPGSDALAAGVRADDGSVALRISAHPLACAVAAQLGYAIIATSANRSGEPPCTSANEAWSALGNAPEIAVLDGGTTPGGAPSTVVDPRATPPQLIRRGAIRMLW